MKVKGWVGRQGASWWAAVSLQVAVLAGGAGAAWWVYEGFRGAEEMRVRTEFEGVAGRHLASVEREVALFVDVLASLGPLYELSDRISAEDFQEFAEKGLVFPRKVIGGFGFAQWVPEEVRRLLEAPEDASAGLVFLDFDPGSWSFRPARQRTAYFPLMFQDPPDSLGLPLGVDLSGHPWLASGLARALASRSPAVVGEPTLPVGGGAAPRVAGGMYVLVPRVEVAGPVMGASITVGLLRPEEILRRAILGGDEGLRFGLDAAGEEKEEQGLVWEGAGWRFVSMVGVGDGSLRFWCEAPKGWVEGRGGRRPVWIFAAGLMMTGLATVLTGVMLRREQVVKELVVERTQELEASHRQLEEAMGLRMRLEQEMLDISSREQQRVGRDLHDSVGQKLSGAVYMSRALLRLLPEEEGEAGGTAKRIHETLKESVAQVRRMAHGLSPVALSPEGLSDGLRRLGKESAEAFGVVVDGSDVEAVSPRDEAAAVHLFQVAQEAIHNAVRHGGAKRIVLSLDEEGGWGRLRVKDDGRGLQSGASQSGGMGLRIMRYRAEMLGGEFGVRSESGKGTEVEVRFPLAG
ncbi:MAG TPA: histidine kinase [Kiritimatiellia bacterium]|nr:histidine kinase [Kiritimatiellia bacterium]